MTRDGAELLTCCQSSSGVILASISQSSRRTSTSRKMSGTPGINSSIARGTKPRREIRDGTTDTEFTLAGPIANSHCQTLWPARAFLHFKDAPEERASALAPCLMMGQREITHILGPLNLTFCFPKIGNMASINCSL